MLPTFHSSTAVAGNMGLQLRQRRRATSLNDEIKDSGDSVVEREESVTKRSDVGDAYFQFYSVVHYRCRRKLRALWRHYFNDTNGLVVLYSPVGVHLILLSIMERSMCQARPTMPNIFPGFGMGLIISGSSRVHDVMLLAGLSYNNSGTNRVTLCKTN
ncbi:hypothetical protein L1987_78097 [Smallanthus sonchifolius]|uniref:Uncharacterized protein n=1 Tax=Smallanthus sonchifolius TaxID=185202 RepID=A0ACB8ZCS6_9ASTR|nr:hypothetical protein L1987_78097 [Smallanthus sonchifolius]